jgi:PDZ domain-containing protein
LAGVAGLILLGGFVLPSHLITVEPGPVADVATLVEPISAQIRAGAGADSTLGGGFLLTTILADRAGPVGLWRALTDPDVNLAPRALYVPAGMTDETYGQWGLAVMAESQAVAAWQAWVFLGNATELESDGGKVYFVSRFSPARGLVREGDLIVSWTLCSASGRYVTAAGFEESVREACRSAPGGPDPSWGLGLELLREGAPHSVTLELTARDLATWPFLGLATAAAGARTNPAVPVSFPPGDIGGPSGGLMLALQIVDDFDPADLTAGCIVAGTGTIGPGGVVGPVGGVAMKLKAAARAGAAVFLIPGEDYPEARAAAEEQGLGAVALVAVGRLADAYQYLASLTARNRAEYNGADFRPEALEQALWMGAGR